MQIEIVTPQAANGVLQRALDNVQLCNRLPAARELLHHELRASRVYRIEDGTDFVRVIDAFHRNTVAMVSV